MVSGIDVVLFRPDDELKRLAGRALELGIADAVHRPPGRGRRSREAAVGKRRRAAMAGRLGGGRRRPWFYYSNGNGFYHHHRSWIDDPNVPLAHLRSYVERLQAGEDIARPLAEVSAERDRITARVPRAADRSRGGCGVRSEPRVSPARCSRTSRATTSTSSTGTTRSSGTRSASSARCWPTTGSSRTPRTSSTCSATRSPMRSSTCGSRGRPGRRDAARGYWPPIVAAPQADHGGDAQVHAPAGARRGAGCDHRADDDHAVGHHHRAGPGMGGPRTRHRRDADRLRRLTRRRRRDRARRPRGRAA